MTAKELAARAAVALVEDGMTVGLGSGSTANYAIRALGERVRDGLRITGVPASDESLHIALKIGIPLQSDPPLNGLDIVIDGADEVDPDFRLIKGGGGAMVRERLVAEAGRRVVTIVDPAKLVNTLGAFPLPVAVIPFGAERTRALLSAFCANSRFRRRDGKIYVTDDGLFIVDLHCGAIPDPKALHEAVKLLPGVVDTGLFFGLTTDVFVGRPDGKVEHHLAEDRPAPWRHSP